MSISYNPEKSYYMFNKPTGCITARTDATHPTVMDYFKKIDNPNLHPVGRLDKDTEGLLIITDDGQFNQWIMRPENHVVKTYAFTAFGELTDDNIAKLEQGIYFTGDEQKTAPCKITVTFRSTLGEMLPKLSHIPNKRFLRNRPEHPITVGTIAITEGRKHHVKRLIKHARGCVIELKRLSIGGLHLDENLSPGKFRELSKEELLSILTT